MVTLKLGIKSWKPLYYTIFNIHRLGLGIEASSLLNVIPVHNLGGGAIVPYPTDSYSYANAYMQRR